MKIVIAGAGRVGRSIAQELVKEKHNITVIEGNPEKLKKIGNNLDVLTILGNAASYDILKEADVKNADLLIAVTREDEINLLCCLSARKMGVPHTIARVRNTDYYKQAAFLNEELGLSMTINPEEETANEISRILRFPVATKVEAFANSKAELVEIKISEESALNGVDLATLRADFGNVIICAVKRNGEVFIPRGDYVITVGDKLNMVGSYKEINQLVRKVSKKFREPKKIMLVGGGDIAYYLINKLANTNMSLKILEKDKLECRRLKDLFPKISVIQGGGADPEVLGEEGIEVVDAFVAITNDDDDNIISSMFALSSNDGKVITKIKESKIINMLSDGQLDSIVQPSSIATERVVRFVRSMQNAYDKSGIEAMYYLFGQTVEILEFKIFDKFAYDNIPIRDLKVAQDAVIASIIHQGRCIIPTGDDVICSGDTVILSTTRNGVISLEDVIEA